MFDFGTTDIPVAAKDNLADLVLKRYRHAVTYQGTENVGGKPLRTVLRECYEQANSILPASDADMVEALGVAAYIGVTAVKGGVAQAFLMESLVAADALPWTIDPTPIPQLSRQGRLEALNLVKERLFESPLTPVPPASPALFPGTSPAGAVYTPAAFAGGAAPVGAGGLLGDPESLLELVSGIKARVMEEEEKRAKSAAKKMERLMLDQCAEGGWRQAMAGFLYNFVFYPYGIIHGPVPTRRARLSWTGDKISVKREMFYSWEAVSPWDFWYSPDSRDAQTGTAVFIRKRLTRRQLLEMREMKSYLKDQVDKLMEEAETKDGYPFRWLSENPDQPDNYISAWAGGVATIDQLTHYGFVSGRELAEYGLTGLEDHKFYDATITVIGGYTVQVFIAPDPTVNIRPVFTASFYKSRDRIANYGISQRLRDVDRSYTAAFRYLIRNMAFASEPVPELDYLRLSKFMDKDALMDIGPGQVLLVDNELSPSNKPAVQFHTMPDNTAQFARILDYFMELGHLVTNIPAALHGTAVGTGANRTFRGMANLQANAVKSLQAAVGNIDETVFLPMGELLYNYNMLYEDDPSIKGDSKVMAQGVLGLFAREMERNNALELLQLVGSIGAQLGESASPLVDWALRRALTAMKVPELVAERVSFTARSPEAPPEGGGAPPPPPQAAGTPAM
jgi:hypothetical protein